MEPSHLQQHTQFLVTLYGGIRPAARVLETDPGHLKRILDGQKEPSEKLARRMGLKKHTVYTPIDDINLDTGVIK